MSKTAVYIVDDHEIVREGLAALLSGVPGIEVKALFPDAMSLLESLEKDMPDVLLLDIGLPDINGIELARRLRIMYSKLPILIISANTDDKHLIGALKAGVKGFIPKDVERNELCEAIRRVAVGEKYFSSQISQNMQNALIKQFDTIELSEREKEIAILLADGLSYKEIGNQLFISERTVETHKNNALKKLGLKNTTQLVVWTVENLK
ncbi:MAG: response regulator transcription factor [Bacteroidales bacterium]|jgi:DNA-binding NarL/FixJ family response regulator|nr:response regulator transcription factor [Bacteroidales bacterium]MDD4385155.1 response regulator transcription factor [Bacteroidales bacterium]MDY0197699.1 response regulator transcription factor [Tenuifilaceae bacterium]